MNEEKQVYIVECGKIHEITVEVHRLKDGTEYICPKNQILQSLKGRTWAYTYKECKAKLLQKIEEELSTLEKEYKKKLEDLNSSLKRVSKLNFLKINFHLTVKEAKKVFAYVKLIKEERTNER